MTHNKRPQLDVKALSKKYSFSVNRVIKCWKANKKDTEIASELGVDLFQLACLRKDLENHAFFKDKVISSIFLFEK